MDARTRGNPLVLICDDEPLIGPALCRALRRAGVEAVAITDGRQLLETARRGRPHLILLDVRQGELDGCDLLAALKRDAMTKDIIVVMISANGDLRIRQRCAELGAHDYQLKPFAVDFIPKMALIAIGASRDNGTN